VTAAPLPAIGTLIVCTGRLSASATSWASRGAFWFGGDLYHSRVLRALYLFGGASCQAFGEGPSGMWMTFLPREVFPRVQANSLLTARGSPP
jgi:hypothetical protein